MRGMGVTSAGTRRPVGTDCVVAGTAMDAYPAAAEYPPECRRTTE